MTHLDALKLNLSNERRRLQNAKTDGERALRAIWVQQLEKEVSGEDRFIAPPEMDEDKLLAELMA